MDERVLAGIGPAVTAYVGTGQKDLFPGAVVVVERSGAIAFRRAWGLAQAHGAGHGAEVRRPMRDDTIFDLASLTKACAAAPLLMRLVATGVLDLGAPVRSLVPEFDGPDKAGVTVRDLLTHRAGLWEWWPLYIEARTRAEVTSAAAQLPLRYAPRDERHYSDIGLVLAGAIVEGLTDTRVDELAHEAIFHALDLDDTGFLPPSSLRPRIAATSTADVHERAMLATGEPYPTTRSPEDFHEWREHTLVGEAEDGNAHHALGGVAAHAGLFATAEDVARLGRAFLDSTTGKSRWMASEVARSFITGHDGHEPLVFFGDRRAEVGLGHGGFGHSGFTGTQLFIEPETDLVVVMLTNRTHRRRLPYPGILPAWADVLRIASDALVRPSVRQGSTAVGPE